VSTERRVPEFQCSALGSGDDGGTGFGCRPGICFWRRSFVKYVRCSPNASAALVWFQSFFFNASSSTQRLYASIIA